MGRRARRAKKNGANVAWEGRRTRQLNHAADDLDASRAATNVAPAPARRRGLGWCMSWTASARGNTR